MQFAQTHTHIYTQRLKDTNLTIAFTRSAIFWAFKKGGAAASGRKGIEEDISSNRSRNRSEWLSKGPHHH